eukprot:scaffold42906_cov161-Skeletonema_dohrnii-CCMP3373.AAC.1
MAFTSTTRAPSNLKFWYVEARNDPFWGNCLERFKRQDPDDKVPPERPAHPYTQTKRKIIIDTTLKAQHNHNHLLLLHLPQGTNPLLCPETRGLILQEMTGAGVEDTIQKETVTTFETIRHLRSWTKSCMNGS